MEKDELQSTVIDLVNTAWEKKMPVLLSNLGSERGGELTQAAKQISGSLSKFLLEHLSDNVKIIKHSRVSAAIGVIPNNKETEEIQNYDAVLDKRLSPYDNVDRKTQFGRSFWTAFRKKLGPDERRYIELHGYNNFSNLPNDDEPPEGMKEITKEYIAADDSVSDFEVYQNIEKWMEVNNFQADDFSVRKTKLSRVSSRAGLHADASILDHLLYSLDPLDLKRIQMPLDIIRKLGQLKP